uniref:Putative nucleotidyltransferase n=1 Tax=viral metagenome TaxID=1070528 RepID=A0A6M3KZJ4_9ZZZZ
MEEQILAENNKILEIVTGSYLYGTNLETSDKDYVGIFLPSEEYILGFKKIEEVDFSIKDKNEEGKNTEKALDRKLYEFRKFITLALENNPNILEILFVNKENIVFMNDIGEQLLLIKHLFPYKGLKQKFLGYAFAQRHKMVIKKDNYFDLQNGLNYLSIYFKEENYSKTLLEIVCFGNYPDFIKKRFDKNNNIDFIQIGDLLFVPSVTVKIAKQRLEERLDKVGNREELLTKYGYDCYHQNTEFLTENGWKKYDKITNDRLATVNQTNYKLEFQHFYERVKKKFIGKLYFYNSCYSSFCVTLNHRMFLSRRKENNWNIQSLKNIFNSKYSRYLIMNNVKNKNEDYPIDKDLLVLIGLYVSEGNIAFRNNKIKSLKISQTPKGKLEVYSIMRKLSFKFGFKEYTYMHNNTEETSWVTHNKELINFLYKYCGNLSSKKRLPKFITLLSKSQANILLYGLILGDGTEKINKYVYYTNNELLANDVQVLAILAEKDTNKCGPYLGKSNFNDKLVSMYQVVISKKEGNPKKVWFNAKVKKYKRHSGNYDNRGGKLINYQGNIVCFSVPNELLITRFNGKVAIQGNTKFGMHLLRLMLEGIELLKTGEIQFPLKERELLREVREGKWTIEKILNYSYELEKEIESLVESSKLPSKPNYKIIEKFTIDKLKEIII